MDVIAIIRFPEYVRNVLKSTVF